MRIFELSGEKELYNYIEELKDGQSETIGFYEGVLQDNLMIATDNFIIIAHENYQNSSSSNLKVKVFYIDNKEKELEEEQNKFYNEEMLFYEWYEKK